MKVLVTGGAGNIGRTLVRYMSAQHDVTALDIKDKPEEIDSYVRADILDLDAMKEALRGFDAVVHLAAIPYPLPNAPEKTFQVNTMGTYNVLEACAVNGIKRFGFASSDSTIGLVFGKPGRTPHYLPLDEDHPTEPEDAYGLSKLVGEQLCRSYALRTGMNVTIIRPPWVWQKAQADTYREMVNKPEAWKECLWNYIHELDLARAFQLGLEKQWESGCETFFVAAAENGTRLATRELLERFLPNVSDIRAPLVGRRSLIDTTKAQRMLGWIPQHTWEEII